MFGKKKADEQQKKVWKCPHCNMTFDDKERLKKHERKAHSERGGGDLPTRSPFGF